MNPILLTGAAGFIGARYAEHCNRLGIPLISVDRASYFKERTEHQGIDFGTLVDRDSLQDWLALTRPTLQAVIHMGACARTTELDEAFLYRVNVKYSQVLWNYCAQNKVPFVYASSAATYGAGELGYNDDESLIPQLKPLNPYGESKRLFDLWALDQEGKGVSPPYWSGFKFFNVYGFGERHKGSMASVILHATDQILRPASGGRMKLFQSHREGIADGHQKRDFVFVEDVIKVLEFARTQPVKRGIFNLGTGQAQTFLDLAHSVFKALNLAPKIDFIPTPEALRERYQYFTQAEMGRLRKAGYLAPFATLEAGVKTYLDRLAAICA